MLYKLKLSSFKAFDALDIDLKPLTIFLGPNNSGKSSIIASLRILVQTVESYDPQIPILLNGMMGDFGTYRDIVYNNRTNRKISIAVTTTRSHRLRGVQQLYKVKESFWDVRPEMLQNIDLRFRYRTKRREIVLDSVGVEVGNTSLLKTKYSDDSEIQLPESIAGKIVPASLKSTLARSIRMYNFMPSFVIPFGKTRDDSSLSEFLTKEVEQKLRKLRFENNIINGFQNVEYLGPMRVPPARTFLFTGERRKRVGITGEHSLSILVMDSFRGGEKSSQITHRISQWLNAAGIASDFKLERLTERHYEVRIQHPKTKEYQNFADVGYGNSQVLPVLIGGYNAGTGATFMIEEPEIHLHPKAQAQLGDFFLDLYQHGVQSIIETHSEHMILRLQQHIAAREISAENVAVYYVTSDDEQKLVKQLRIDQNGKFIDEWPEGFFPERLEEAKKLAQIRYKNQFESSDA